MKNETVRFVAMVVLVIAFGAFFLLRFNGNKIGQYQIASAGRAFTIIDTRTGDIVQSIGLAAQTNLPGESTKPMAQLVDLGYGDLLKVDLGSIHLGGIVGIQFMNTLDVDLSGYLLD